MSGEKRGLPQEEGWDELVAATEANPEYERARIAQALKAIRVCCERDGIVDVGEEITRRAEMYARRFPHLMLTPAALARHWNRVLPRKSSFENWEERFRES